MAVELPEPLQWVLLLLAGTRWPEADEGELRDMAKEWRTAADDLEHAARSADSAVQRALDGQQGNAAEALGKHWAQFTTGKGTEQDPGYFPGTIQACRGMGDMLEGMANSAETAKIQIIAQLGILAFEIATAEAEAPFTAGASLLEIPAAIAIGREAVTAILKKLLQEALKHAIKMGVQMGAINLMAQTIEVAEGHRKSIDVKELGKAVEGGAISGAIGNQLGKELGAVGGKVLPKGAMDSLGGKVVHGAATGVGTDVLTQLAMTGKVDPNSLLGSGLSGGAGAGLHAGANAAREHFNGPPKFAPPHGEIGGPVPSGSGGRQDGPPPSTPHGEIGDPVPSGSGGRQDGPPSSSEHSTYHGPDGSPTGESRPGGLTPFGADRPSGPAGGGSELGANRPAKDSGTPYVENARQDAAPPAANHLGEDVAARTEPTPGGERTGRAPEPVVDSHEVSSVREPAPEAGPVREPVDLHEVSSVREPVAERPVEEPLASRVTEQEPMAERPSGEVPQVVREPAPEAGPVREPVAERPVEAPVDLHEVSSVREPVAERPVEEPLASRVTEQEPMAERP
ncbi:hypothetical protein ABT095_22285, partial [Kitasatospora sp. NPDC002227]|uniref:WXG100 family type VII secretion target n=1 Tax=Kitasatospora sp. NPDC002227 TaxID=3154773 RepID=UPI003333115F